MAVEKLPPQNIEAEQSVLGSLLIDRDAVIKVATFLRPEDFYREAHGVIYGAILDLHDRRQPLDFVTLCDELERKGQLEEVGGASYIASLINVVPTAIHVEHYGRIVERTATLRRLIGAAGRIAGIAYESTDELDQVLDQAEQILFGISQRRLAQELVPISKLLGDYYDRIDYLHHHRGEVFGLSTGFPDLDKLLGGFQPSDLIIVAGRPSMGKTSLALSIVQNAALKHRARVAIFSLEMSGEQLVQRLISSETGIDSQRLRAGLIDDRELEMVAKAIGDLSEAAIFVDDSAVASPMEIRTKARRLYAELGLDLLVIDYLQLMTGGAGVRVENRVQEISYISRTLKGLARELNLPVVALSQLSRAVEARQDRRPILSDLRESGSIEQDSDVVVFIYRDDMYYPDEEVWHRAFPNKVYPKGIAEIIVAKHRHGPTDKIELLFRKEQARFESVAYRKEPEASLVGEVVS
jgi:replicative DNA helicase